jgi:hypothetical protein
MTSHTSFGGYVFVQKQKDQALQPLLGLVTTQVRTEVLLDEGKRPWFATASAESRWTKNGSKKHWWIGLHRVAPRVSPTGEYVVQQLCQYEADR